jgi:hypothetical protein
MEQAKRSISLKTTKVVNIYYNVEVTEEEYNSIIFELNNHSAYEEDGEGGCVVDMEQAFWDVIPDALAKSHWDTYEHYDDEPYGEELDEHYNEDVQTMLSKDLAEYFKNNSEE